jgi:hypothetical protein
MRDAGSWIWDVIRRDAMLNWHFAIYNKLELMNIASRIATARGEDLIVEIRNVQVASVSEAAGLFGLSTVAEIYHEVSASEAERVIWAVLIEDMAYSRPLVPRDVANLLAREFIEEFALEEPHFYTNGEYGMPRSHTNIGPGWIPATKFTFDTGILVITPLRTACAWFMDED